MDEGEHVNSLHCRCLGPAEPDLMEYMGHHQDSTFLDGILWKNYCPWGEKVVLSVVRSVHGHVWVGILCVQDGLCADYLGRAEYVYLV